jgi:hypothetical protein
MLLAEKICSFFFFNLNLGTILQEGYFQHEGNIKFKNKKFSSYIYKLV